MKNNDFDHFKKRLLEERNVLLQKAEDRLRDSRELREKDPQDEGDFASSESEYLLTSSMGSYERQRLAEIDRALEKIKEDTFGICEECEEKIGKKRLEAIPWATLCLSCREKFEKGFGISPNFEEASWFSSKQMSENSTSEDEEEDEVGINIDDITDAETILEDELDNL